MSAHPPVSALGQSPIDIHHHQLYSVRERIYFSLSGLYLRHYRVLRRLKTTLYRHDVLRRVLRPSSLDIAQSQEQAQVHVQAKAQEQAQEQAQEKTSTRTESKSKLNQEPKKDVSRKAQAQEQVHAKAQEQTQEQEQAGHKSKSNCTHQKAQAQTRARTSE
jgi:hypothetical protein